MCGQALHHGESQSSSLADAFGREERLYGAAQRIGVHAGARIRDLNQHETAGFELGARQALRHDLVADLDGQRSAARHGVAGVECKIEEGELELCGIDGRHRAVAM